jgi:hypothetical protein
MPTKEFSDYIIMVLDSKERVYHMFHLRYTKDMKMNMKPFGVMGQHEHNYCLNLDRAYRIRWAPWKKLDFKKRFWFIYFFKELIRSKKIGLLLFQEPTDPLHGVNVPVQPIHVSRIRQPSGEMRA